VKSGPASSAVEASRPACGEEGCTLQPERAARSWKKDSPIPRVGPLGPLSQSSRDRSTRRPVSFTQLCVTQSDRQPPSSPSQSMAVGYDFAARGGA
jgi:hypothetical protein